MLGRTMTGEAKKPNSKSAGRRASPHDPVVTGKFGKCQVGHCVWRIGPSRLSFLGSARLLRGTESGAALARVEKDQRECPLR